MAWRAGWKPDFVCDPLGTAVVSRSGREEGERLSSQRPRVRVKDRQFATVVFGRWTSCWCSKNKSRRNLFSALAESVFLKRRSSFLRFDFHLLRGERSGGILRCMDIVGMGNLGIAKSWWAW